MGRGKPKKHCKTSRLKSLWWADSSLLLFSLLPNEQILPGTWDSNQKKPMVSSRVRLCRWFLPSKKAWAHATAFPSGLCPSSLFSWHCLKALWMPFTIGFTKKDLASRPFLPHMGANSQSHAALENSPKPKGDHAALLPYSKERAFPPLSLEGPFCEVLTTNSGVSVAQATPFLSSPGAMM